MENYRKSTLDERYENDVTFNRVVKTMEQLIYEFGVTPSEMREAVFYAHYKYEMENPRAIAAVTLEQLRKIHK